MCKERLGGEEGWGITITSWLPYSTDLYLDFHLLCSMTKLKEQSREICWFSPWQFSKVRQGSPWAWTDSGWWKRRRRSRRRRILLRWNQFLVVITSMRLNWSNMKFAGWVKVGTMCYCSFTVKIYFGMNWTRGDLTNVKCIALTTLVFVCVL